MSSGSAFAALTDSSGNNWESISTPSFRVDVAFWDLQIPPRDDQGVFFSVYGHQGDDWTELFKFDLFDKVPHWHRCHPNAPDDLIPVDRRDTQLLVTNSLDLLRHDLASLLTEQGFSEFASPDHVTEFESILPAIEKRLQELARDRSPVQLVTRTSPEERARRGQGWTKPEMKVLRDTAQGEIAHT